MAEMISGARAWVDLPAPPPLGGGVLAVANVEDGDDVHLMGAQAESDACVEANFWDEWCTMSPVATKLFDGAADVFEGDPFMVYAGVECDFQRLDEAKARAVRRFDFAEGRAIDTHFITLFATATDLGGPFPIVQAIGIAEAYAATVYGARPTLLIPRQFIPCAASHGAVRENLDGSLTTVQGSTVGNITAPVEEPAVDEGEIYVTGQITLLRGGLKSYSTPQHIADDGTFKPPRALAERVYVPLLDCFTAKVQVTCS